MKNIPGKQLINNSFLILFNTGYMMIISWVISIWIARQLGPSDYGIFNLVLWLSSTVSWVLGMGLIHAITKFIAEYKGKNDNSLLKPILLYVLKIEICVTSFTTIVLLLFKSEIANYFFSPKESFYFFLTTLGLLPGVITAVFSATIEGIQKFKYFTYSNLIITPFSFICKIIVLLMDKGISGLLYVMLAFSFVNVFFYGFVLWHEKVFSGPLNNLPIQLRKRINSYNKSILAILACDKIIWDKSENLFLGRFCSAIEIGYYNLGFNVTQKFMSILPTAFWKVLFPKMSTYCGSGDKEKMKRLFYISSRYLAFFSFPVGTAGIILSHQILLYLYGPDYISATSVLKIIFFSTIISNLANPGSAILYGYDKQAFIYKFGFFLALFNITIDILLIKSHGAMGAALCHAITTILGSVGGLFYTCKLMSLKYPFGSLFKIFCSSLLMGSVMHIILLYSNSLTGMITSLLIGFIIYLLCSFFLGTFEQEDYFLLQSTKAFLPGNTKRLLDFIIKLSFRSNNPSIYNSDQV